MENDVSLRPGLELNESQLAIVYSPAVTVIHPRHPFSDFGLAHLAIVYSARTHYFPSRHPFSDFGTPRQLRCGSQ